MVSGALWLVDRVWLCAAPHSEDPVVVYCSVPLPSPVLGWGVEGPGRDEQPCHTARGYKDHALHCTGLWPLGGEGGRCWDRFWRPLGLG